MSCLVDYMERGGGSHCAVIALVIHAVRHIKPMEGALQHTQYIEPMLVHCWFTVYDAGQCLTCAGTGYIERVS